MERNPNDDAACDEVAQLIERLAAYDNGKPNLREYVGETFDYTRFAKDTISPIDNLPITECLKCGRLGTCEEGLAIHKLTVLGPILYDILDYCDESEATYHFLDAPPEFIGLN